LSSHQQEFLDEVVCESFENSEHADDAIFYVKCLSREYGKFPSYVLDDCFLPNHVANDTGIIFALFSLVSKLIKAKHYSTFEDVIREAMESCLLVPACADPGPAQDSAVLVIAAAFGRITMLYNVRFPGPKQERNHFSLDDQQHRTISIRLDSAELTLRPLIEILNHLPYLLPDIPRKSVPVASSGQYEHSNTLPPPDALTVSCLNAKTLLQLAGLEIRWVNCVSSHLDFDLVNRRLSLFCLPSFCRMASSDMTPFAV
jgi:hypothetical protein